MVAGEITTGAALDYDKAGLLLMDTVPALLII